MHNGRVLITGGVGFIGTHLCRALVAAGKQVLCLDIRKPEKRNKVEGVHYIQGDIRTQEVQDIVARYQADTVFHLAAHIDNLASMEDPLMDASHNISGTLNILQGVRRAGRGKVIFASSCAVYGNQEQFPTHESAELQLGSPYGLSKRTAEQYLDLYYKHFGVPYIALRKANVYGPGQDASRETGVITVFTSRLLAGQPVAIYNDGESTRDYMHIEDTVDAYLRASESDYVGVLNIGTGVQVSTKQVFHLVKNVVGVDIQEEYREDVKDAVRFSGIDARKAQEVLGWKPRVVFEDGVEKTVEWYRTNI